MRAIALTLDKMKFISWFDFVNKIKVMYQKLTYKLFWDTSIDPRSINLIFLI